MAGLTLRASGSQNRVTRQSLDRAINRTLYKGPIPKPKQVQGSSKTLPTLKPEPYCQTLKYKPQRLEDKRFVVDPNRVEGVCLGR